MQKLVAARESGFQFAEGITLNVAQLNIEMDKLRLARWRLHGHIPFADRVRKISVVARVRAKTKPQSGVSRQLLGGTGRPNADAHRAFIRQKPIQPHLPFVVARKLHVDFGRRLHLPGRRVVKRTVHSAGKRNAFTGLPVQQMRTPPVMGVFFIITAKDLCLLGR